MFKRLAIGCMALWVFVANAEPIPIGFTSTQYDTSAAAIAGGAAEFNSDSSLTTALPLVTSATVFDDTDFASGSGIAANGLLTAQSEASSVASFASAVGTSEFKGTFNLDPFSFLQLSVNMTGLDLTDAAAFSSGTLFVLVTVDGATYLDEQLFADGLYTYTVGPSTGGGYSLSLLLSSEANTVNGGNASNFASVTFDAVTAVPEPSAMLLCGIGVIVCVWSQRRVSASGRQSLTAT